MSTDHGTTDRRLQDNGPLTTDYKTTGDSQTVRPEAQGGRFVCSYRFPGRATRQDGLEGQV